ncbi:MAG: hypothetical protein RLO52_07940 [Sandaracinaceae bacterium]|nr:hypothetical protein [Myxococcales bacterium]
MIGGHDVVMEGPTEPGELRLILRGLRSVWPDGVVEDVETGEQRPLADPAGWQLGSTEVLVYRDRPSLESWEARGQTEDNAEAMVHVIFLPKSITWIVDDEGQLVEMVEELRVQISSRRLSPPAEFYRTMPREEAA